VSTRILLADDHPIVRTGIRLILEARSDLRVIAEAANGEDAVRLADEHRPDVAVIDLTMPRLSGIEAIRRIRARGAARCIAFTMHETRANVALALQAGAAGYVVKSGGAAELGEAIDAVRAGRSYLSPAVAHWAVQAVLQPGERPPSGLNLLTSREREVLQLIAEGLTSKEIATSLGVSTKTVETHRAHLMAKLEIRKVSRLVRVAIEEGLVGP
jgi:DNA-binding NarL/FixJ family response regulator